MSKLTIVLTNDDGIMAPGLEILERRLQTIAEVTVIAPVEQMSAVSHSLTLTKPLRVDFVSANKYAVYGTPADCIAFAVRELLPDIPALVVSGINNGPNLGEDVIYSGTVAGAREGALYGITSLAISLANEKRITILPEDYDKASNIALNVIKSILKNNFLYKDVFLNLNVPVLKDREIKGLKVTHLASRKYLGKFIPDKEEGISKYYWVSGDEPPVWEGSEHSDYYAIKNGFASLTPLGLEATAYNRMKEFEILEY
ncbi:MAG: 5'/3'-nucleotidase SurE [Candidatus Hydrogenedentota bacterium]